MIWAGFGPIGNTEKKFGPIVSKFEDGFFMFLGAKKFFFENVVASALKQFVTIVTI